MQSYLKAYGSTYKAAKSKSYALLKNPKICDEIKRLKEIKRKTMFIDAVDVVDLHMRIAFADITDFVEFRNLETDDDVMDSKIRSEVYIKNSDMVDGMLLTEVSLSKNGAKVKLVDRQKSLDFLERYFLLNPMDKHKQAYDNKFLKLEEKKLGGEVSKELLDDWLDDID